MNFLPLEEKKNLGRERLRRFFVVFSLGVGAFGFASVILMLPSYLGLELERNNLLRSIAISRKAPLAGEVNAVESEIEGLNLKLELFRKNEREERSLAPLLGKILSVVSASVSLREFFYEKLSKTNPEQITLGGKAQSRQALLKFASDLERTGEFKKVQSPVSNLLKETNVVFSLILELN